MPDDFLDPIMGHIMREPVRLPSSGTVLDRAVALAHIKRFGRDLVDNTPLHESQLEPVNELMERLQEWREKREETHADLDKVQRREVVEGLVDADAGLPPEVIEALCEADRLDALAKSAEEAAHADSLRGSPSKSGTGSTGGEINGTGGVDNAADAAEEPEGYSLLLRSPSVHSFIRSFPLSMPVDSPVLHTVVC